MMTTGVQLDYETIFNTWYDANESRIRELCLGYIPDADYEGDADDLAQDIYTAIWENIETFDSTIASFDTWANRVAINTLNDYIDYQNADKRTAELEEYNDEEYCLYNRIDPQTYEKHSYLIRYIDHLEGINKNVMEMYRDGYSHNEIAAFIGLTKNKVNYAIRHSKQLIREMAHNDEDWDFGEVAVR